VNTLASGFILTKIDII